MSQDMHIAEAATLEAISSAAKATRLYIDNHGESSACGFAWVSIYGVRSNSKLGKELQKNGWRKQYGVSALQYWNPSRVGTQSVDALEAGAIAAANVLKARLGVDASAGSRLD